MEHSLRPRLKSVFPAFYIDGQVYIQGAGYATEIDDPDGKIMRLLSLLDGTRTCQEVHLELSASFPDVSARDVEAAIGDLDAAGFLEDVAASVSLDNYSLERWSRNIGFFEIYSDLATSKYELQQRLQACRVALLGVGGVGSHILYDLAAMGIENVRIVDFDYVQLSNLNRQILYSETDIGRPKVEAAVRRIRSYNSRMRLDVQATRLGSAEDVFSVVRGHDVVIAALDSPKMQIANWVNEGCVAAGVPLITGGVDAQRSLYYTVIPGRSGCVECWRTQAVESDPVASAMTTEMQEMEARRKSGERVGQDLAAFCPLVTMQTACLVAELVRIVTGIAPPVALGRLMEVRFDDFVAREAERWERMPECRVCGSRKEATPDTDVQEVLG
jgi:molybdopterin/thiamine biosynthesis adenylyltransferase